MKSLLAVLTVMVCLFLACGGGGTDDDHTLIENTIRGYVETYNARDYAQCLTYFTGYGAADDAMAALEFFRNMAGEMTFREVAHVAVSGSTATAGVIFTLGGEEATDQMELKKVGSQWKIRWQQ